MKSQCTAARAAALMLAVVAAGACRAAPDTFTATRVDAPNDAEDFFHGLAMNSSAQVLGLVTHEFVDWWYTGPDGKGVTQPDWRVVNSMFGLNDAGQAVGTYLSPDGSLHAFVTDPDGNIIDSNPPGASVSAGQSIDSQGRIVGQRTVGGVTTLFISNATRTVFHTLDTHGLAASAKGIVDGLVVGNVTLASGQVHGFTVPAKGGRMVDLGTFGGTTSAANGVNARHQVVGHADDAAGVTHAFITAADGVTLQKLSDLGTHPAFSRSSFAYGINDEGYVVGSADHLGRQGIYGANAFISGPNGAGLHNLNNFVVLPDASWVVTATAINDRGQILAQDFLDEGPLWLLTPTRSTWREELEADGADDDAP
jgi:probable HAF family extracellular repeat protein